MSINDSSVLKWSNETIRTFSDKLAGLYYDADFLKDQRDADADINLTISMRTNLIRSVANRMILLSDKTKVNNLAWFNVTASDGVTTLANATPNSDASGVDDGAPGDSRQPITGGDIHRIVGLMDDYKGWIADASFGGPGTGTMENNMLNSMIVCSAIGNDPLQSGQVVSFIDNRCTELRNWMEASNGLNLSFVLGVAPNPQREAL